MAKKKPSPVDPRSVPVPDVTHCVFCGKRLSPQAVTNNRVACDECSSPVGKMTEIWENLRLKERHAGTRVKVSDYFETLPTWQAIQHFARQKFAHPKFTTETWTALQHWLSAERDIGEEAFLRMTPTAVEQLLRDDKTAPVAPATNPLAAPKGEGTPVDEVAEMVKRVALLLGGDADQLMAVVTHSKLTTDPKLRALAKLDVRFKGYKSDDLAELLGVSPASIRNSDVWKEWHPKRSTKQAKSAQ